MAKPKELKVTLVKSRFGRLKSHKACVAGLGLRKIGHSRTLENSPAVRGMVKKVLHRPLTSLRDAAREGDLNRVHTLLKSWGIEDE